jgi:FkbM family methyltransferase
LRHRMIRFTGWIFRLFAMNFGFSVNPFYAIPISTGWVRWVVKRKGGQWRRIELRPETSDLEVFNQIFVYEDYRFSRIGRWKDVQKAYREILSQGRRPLVLDCGANIGLSSLYFKELFPESSVWALEPDVENFRMMLKNCGDRDIRAIHGAVSNKDGFVRLVHGSMGNWGIRTEIQASGRADSVPCFSPVGLVKQAGRSENASPFLIKIDIEGHERQLFSSGTKWLGLFKVVVIELHDWLFPGASNSRSFLREIAKRNFDFIYIGENVFCINNE